MDYVVPVDMLYMDMLQKCDWLVAYYVATFWLCQLEIAASCLEVCQTTKEELMEGKGTTRSLGPSDCGIH